MRNDVVGGPLSDSGVIPGEEPGRRPETGRAVHMLEVLEPVEREGNYAPSGADEHRSRVKGVEVGEGPLEATCPFGFSVAIEEAAVGVVEEGADVLPLLSFGEAMV